MSDLKFSSLFKIPNWAMIVYKSHSEIVRDRVWFISMTSIEVFLVSCLIYSVIHYDIPEGRIAEAIKNSSMAIAGSVIIFRTNFLRKNQESLKELVAMVDRDYELSKEFSREQQEIVRKYAKRGFNVCWFYFVISIGGLVFFPCKALLLTAHSYWKGENKLVPMFEFTLPQYLDMKKEEPSIYWTFFMMEFCFTLCCIKMGMVFEPLVSIFLLHSCGQIDVLNQKLLSIFTNNSSPVQVRSELRLVVIKIQQIYTLVDWFQVNYAFYYEIIIKTSTVLLPCAVLQINESWKQGSFNIEFLQFFLASLVIFAIPCYYGDLLMEKGESFRQAIYSCGWESHPDPKTRKMLLNMLTRATKPLDLKSIFFNLSLDTFAVMCKDAYAIFNLMTAVMK